MVGMIRGKYSFVASYVIHIRGGEWRGRQHNFDCLEFSNSSLRYIDANLQSTFEKHQTFVNIYK